MDLSYRLFDGNTLLPLNATGLNKVAVYSDAEPDQQHQHNTEWRDCKIRRETGEATYKRGAETYKRGGTPGGKADSIFWPNCLTILRGNSALAQLQPAK